jgi:hypothetical protein
MPTTYYVVYRWPDGRDEVRYERPIWDSTLRHEVALLQRRQGAECPYRIEYVHPDHAPATPAQ